MESTGAFGSAAEILCIAVREIREMKSYENHARPNSEEKNRTLVDPQQASISITFQRHNPQMIIERQPHPPVFGPRESWNTTRLKQWAMRKICIKGRGPMSRMEWECPTPSTLTTLLPRPNWEEDPFERQVNGPLNIVQAASTILT